MRSHSHFVRFANLILWPWLVLPAILVTVLLGVMRLCLRRKEEPRGSGAPVGPVVHFVAAPVVLLTFAARLRQWRLVIAIVLLVPVMTASVIGLFVVPPEWHAGQGVTEAMRPSWGHPLGTNGDGVDVLALVVQGCRNSYLSVTLSLVVILLLGVPLGVMSEQYRWGKHLRTVVTSLETLPLLFGMMILAGFSSIWIGQLEQHGAIPRELHSVLRSGVVGLGIGVWLVPSMATLVAERIAHFRRLDFIDASLATGVPLSRVIWYHIVYRNSLAEIAILASHLAGLSILFETSLGYLFSIGTAKLGQGFYYSLAQLLTTQEAKQAILFHDNWWIVVPPMMLIVSAVLGLLMLGDGLAALMRLRAPVTREPSCVIASCPTS